MPPRGSGRPGRGRARRSRRSSRRPRAPSVARRLTVRVAPAARLHRRDDVPGRDRRVPRLGDGHGPLLDALPRGAHADVAVRGRRPRAHILGARRFARHRSRLTSSRRRSAAGSATDRSSAVRVPVAETPELRDDYALFDLARARRRYAEADYWASYRLTFLFRERDHRRPDERGRGSLCALSARPSRPRRCSPTCSIPDARARTRRSGARPHPRQRRASRRRSAGGYTVFFVTRAATARDETRLAQGPQSVRAGHVGVGTFSDASVDDHCGLQPRSRSTAELRDARSGAVAHQRSSSRP